MSSKMLRGRFKGGISPMILGFSSSLDTDKVMFFEDVWGSEAHVLMLAKQGIISKEDSKKILKALEEVKKDHSSGKFVLREELEDVHLNVENYVIEKCGIDFGGKMHTARSRNDQVLTDVKLHLRGEVLEVMEHIIGLQEALLDLSEKYSGDVMPGFTHMQDAQPITFGFWASSYASMLSRDFDRILCSYGHINSSPLGAGALSGTSFPIDRKYTMQLLGFDSVHEHALDAVSSRDHIVEVLAAFSILMSNLSKLSEELVLWSSFEFGFIEFSDDFATGSSIMPQKKNPDMAELVRGKTGRVYGSLIQVLTILKGLPSGYNRDLQEDREMLWDSVDVVKSSLQVLKMGLKDMKVNQSRMKVLVFSDYSSATELANFLVREKGMSFRKAYDVTGKVVKEMVKEGKDLMDHDSVASLLKKEGVLVSSEKLSGVLDPKKIVLGNKSLGGTSPSEVLRMAKEIRNTTKDARKEIDERKKKIASALKLTEKLIKESL